MRVTPFVVLLALVCATTPALAQGRRDRGPDSAPQKGTKAPDFTLQRLTKDKAATTQTVKLSEVSAKKPVALIFGSYT